MLGRKSTRILFSIFLFFLPSAMEAHRAMPMHKKKSQEVVEGVVYCQSCGKHGTWALDDAEPVAGGKVSVICTTYTKQVTYYKVYETDEQGYYYAPLEGFAVNHLLDHPLHACKVKLVSSPVPHCNLLSNINHGLSGAPLRYENKFHMGHDTLTVVYAAGPLAFHSEQCLPQGQA